jgi:hypothetical protein
LLNFLLHVALSLGEFSNELELLGNSTDICDIFHAARLYDLRINRIIKDSGLYTIVIPSTSPHPTPLECRYEGMMNSSWIHILFQQYFSYGKEISV